MASQIKEKFIQVLRVSSRLIMSGFQKRLGCLQRLQKKLQQREQSAEGTTLGMEHLLATRVKRGPEFDALITLFNKVGLGADCALARQYHKCCYELFDERQNMCLTLLPQRGLYEFITHIYYTGVWSIRMISEDYLIFYSIPSWKFVLVNNRGAEFAKGQQILFLHYRDGVALACGTIPFSRYCVDLNETLSLVLSMLRISMAEQVMDHLYTCQDYSLDERASIGAHWDITNVLRQLQRSCENRKRLLLQDTPHIVEQTDTTVLPATPDVLPAGENDKVTVGYLPPVSLLKKLTKVDSADQVEQICRLAWILHIAY